VRHPHCSRYAALLSHGSTLFAAQRFEPLGSWDAALRAQPAERVARCELLLRFALQTAAGMAHLHSLRVAHCNLKPTNLLVTAGGGVAVADYGVAHLLAPELQQARASGPGAAYLAPEARRLMAGAVGGELTPAADVYSYGVTLAQALLRGEPPAAPGDGGDGQPPYAVERLDSCADAPAGMARLARACLVRDPAARPRFDAILLELEAMAKAFCAAS
jgi:serine/threonine protein kinase